MRRLPTGEIAAEAMVVVWFEGGGLGERCLWDWGCLCEGVAGGLRWALGRSAGGRVKLRLRCEPHSGRGSGESSGVVRSAASTGARTPIIGRG